MRPQEQQLIDAYNNHSDALFRYGVFKISDREMANDLVQETFVRAWQYLVKNGTVDNYKAFLYKIMTNLVIDEYRKRAAPESLETMREEEGFDPGLDDTHRWIDAIDGKQAVQLIKKIPSPYGEAVFMRYVEELSLSEIALITGERENTIAVHIHRGLEKLKVLFHHEQSN
jgi:RNA polymerase sigma-70 factor (ECF subfamily)